MEQLEENIARYLAELDRADRQPSAVTEGRLSRLKDKVAAVKEHLQRLSQIGEQLQEAPDRQVSLTDLDARSNGHQRPRHWNGWIQRPDRCRHQAPSDRGS